MIFEKDDLVKFKKDTRWHIFKEGIFANRIFIVDDVSTGLVYIKALSPREGDIYIDWMNRNNPAGGFLESALEKFA